MKHKYHAKTLKGLESILAKELKDIGAADVHVANRGVDFTGSVSMLYKANLYCRTALRILKPVAKFSARDENDLYRKVMDIPWSEYMHIKNSFAVDATTFSDVFRNSHFVELKVKDAIVDHFRKKTSLRPSVNTQNPEIRINIHVNQNQVLVSLDSSGESLHKRGYRKHLHTASLSEVLAAGMILITGYTGDRPFMNPMCGSGTLTVEAAMIAANMVPGITGRKYCFEYWPDFDDLLYERIRENMPVPVEPPFPITSSDIDPNAVRITKANLRFKGLDKIVKVKKQDFMESAEMDDQGLIVLNPPYGERLENENLYELYSGIGTVLKHRFTGYEAYLLTANFEALKHVGLKPERKIQLFNGKLDCRFVNYKLFAGTMKDKIN